MDKPVPLPPLNIKQDQWMTQTPEQFQAYKVAQERAEEYAASKKEYSRQSPFRSLYTASSAANIKDDPFTKMPLQPMHPGWPIQQNASRIDLKHDAADMFVVVLGHSGLNYSKTKYVGLPPECKLQTILTQEIGIGSLYKLSTILPSIIGLFSIQEESIYFEHFNTIGDTIVDTMKESIRQTMGNRETNFGQSKPVYSKRPGMYSERQWKFSGWRNQGIKNPLNGSVLCFVKDISKISDLLPLEGKLNEDGHKNGIACVEIYSRRMTSGTFELSQTGLLTDLIQIGFRCPAIINIGCNNSVGALGKGNGFEILDTLAEEFGVSPEEFPYLPGEFGELGQIQLKKYSPPANIREREKKIANEEEARSIYRYEKRYTKNVNRAASNPKSKKYAVRAKRSSNALLEARGLAALQRPDIRSSRVSNKEMEVALRNASGKAYSNYEFTAMSSKKSKINVNRENQKGR